MLYLHNTFRYEALDSAQWAVKRRRATAAVHLAGMQRDGLPLTAAPSPGRRWCWGMGRMTGVALIVTHLPVPWQQPVLVCTTRASREQDRGHREANWFWFSAKNYFLRISLSHLPNYSFHVSIPDAQAKKNNFILYQLNCKHFSKRKSIFVCLLKIYITIVRWCNESCIWILGTNVFFFSDNKSKGPFTEHGHSSLFPQQAIF